jgi:hypothetical protein
MLILSNFLKVSAQQGHALHGLRGQPKLIFGSCLYCLSAISVCSVELEIHPAGHERHSTKLPCVSFRSAKSFSYETLLCQRTLCEI